jgi:hypothetical protein
LCYAGAERGAGQDVHDPVDDPEINEADHAAAVARHLHTDHREEA